MSSETELKFQIPAERLAALKREVATSAATRQAMAARYFDTAGDHLAQARLALRLRREGEHWVQTLKGAGAHSLERLEHNVPLTGRRGPAIDLARHAGTAVGDRLAQVLAQAGQPPLVERYRTDLQRTALVLRHRGAQVELALDEGQILAGDLAQPVCEIEFELQRGKLSALLDLAARWALQHGLVLDVRSKSQRGQALALQAAAGGTPLPPRPPALVPPGRLAASGPVAAAAHFQRVLQPLLANAAELSDGQALPAHLRSLRLGLRQLRALCLAHAARWPALADGALAGQLAGLGRRLTEAASGQAEPPAQVLRDAPSQQALLALLALALAPGEATADRVAAPA